MGTVSLLFCWTNVKSRGEEPETTGIADLWIVMIYYYIHVHILFDLSSWSILQGFLIPCGHLHIQKPVVISHLGFKILVRSKILAHSCFPSVYGITTGILNLSEDALYF